MNLVLSYHFEKKFQKQTFEFRKTIFKEEIKMWYLFKVYTDNGQIEQFFVHENYYNEYTSRVEKRNDVATYETEVC